jgi:glycosyltransferase involved in cell wall biosynthesis
MRWVILTDDFLPMPSGVATWTSAIADALVAAGDEVVVYARRRPRLVGGRGYRLFGVPGPSFGRRGGLWTAGAAWRSIVGADRVLASTWPVAVHAVTVAAALGIPVHVVFHGSDLTRPPLNPKGLRRVLRKSTYRWAVSQYLADQVMGCRVLPSPVDLGPAVGTPQSGWGMVARATALKGGDRFVRIVAEAGVSGVIVGDGPELANWKRLASELGANIRFTGRLSAEETLREIASMEVLLHLPRTHPDGSGAEGAGLVLLEAASVGVPGVGCRTGGVPEAVGPGLVLECPDDVAASAAAITGWLNETRGPASRSWLHAHHGRSRAACALREA